MNFLSPWFLIGGLAVAGPVLFHLIRRAARQRLQFSSLLFLRPTPPRATRRRKLEHILLLILRCLGVCLLALGFARPFLNRSTAAAPPAASGHEMVLLVDTSASMRRQGLWEKARAAAAKYLDKAAAGDRVAVISFDQRPHTVVSLADWSSWPLDQRTAMAEQRLAAVSPGWGGTRLGAALTEAAEQFLDVSANAAPPESREVVLISDLQEGANLDGLQGHDWPKNVGVAVERVEPNRRGNAGLEVLDASLASSGSARQARVRVVNASDSDRESFRLSWSQTSLPNFVGEKAEIYVPPGQVRSLPAPELPQGAEWGALHLEGAVEDFGATSWFAVPEVDKVTVAYFGNESANDPHQLRYYLQRAFPTTPRRQVMVESVFSNSLFKPEVLSRASLAVIPSALGAAETAAARQWLTNGKAALLVLTNVEAGATLGALIGAADPALQEATNDYALLGDIDFTHPLFAPFADPQYSDFSRIHFWQHRRWTIPAGLPAHVLAKFDDGSPALAQIPVGKGSLLVMAAGWNPDDSQFALSTKFLPFVQTLLDWSGGAAPSRAQFDIGDAIPSPAPAGEALHWKKPDGKAVELPAGTPFAETDLPGVYTVDVGGKTHRFAVNLPLDESRTGAMLPDELARLGVPIRDAAHPKAAPPPETKRLLLATELENKQKLWRWLIVGLLAVALVEILLGGWFARRVQTLEVAP